MSGKVRVSLLLVAALIALGAGWTLVSSDDVENPQPVAEGVDLSAYLDQLDPEPVGKPTPPLPLVSPNKPYSDFWLKSIASRSVRANRYCPL